jgi:hypothetical protein
MKAAERSEHTDGCKAHTNGVHDQGAGKILPNDAARPLGHSEGLGQAGQIISKKNDIHIGSRTHGNPNIRFCECGGVVDTVTDYRDNSLLRRKVTHSLQLLLREQLGLDLFDAEFFAYRSRHATRIPGQQNRSDSHVMQRSNGAPSFRPNGICHDD